MKILAGNGNYRKLSFNFRHKCRCNVRNKPICVKRPTVCLFLCLFLRNRH